MICLLRGAYWAAGLTILLSFPSQVQSDEPGSVSATELRARAEGGDADAQLALGLMYYTGDGVPQHLGEAARWLRRAAEQGQPTAQSNLGVLYLNGEGVPPNPLEAFKWFTKAASQGLPAAQVNLGQLYLQGTGVRRVPQESARWFRRAADQGDAEGQRLLGTLYAEGQGVPRDPIEASKWLNLAAAQGDNRAGEARRALSRQLAPAQVAEAQRRALAFRPRQEQTGRSRTRKSGTGFFVSTAGYLVTCYHVVEDSTRIVVTTKRGTLPAQLIAADKTNDIALLKVAGTFPALALTNSQAVRLGDAVLTLGYPNVQVQGKQLKLTRGEVNSLAGIQDDSRYFQISAPVQPGNSGGPLLDRFGNVVGLVTLRLDDLRVLWTTGAVPQNVNYALKSGLVLDFLRRAPAVHKLLAPPRVGVESDTAGIVARTQDAVVLIEGN